MTDLVTLTLAALVSACSAVSATIAYLDYARPWLARRGYVPEVLDR